METQPHHLLKGDDMLRILEQLVDKVSHWKDIGLALGFSIGELNEIENMPSLFNEAPRSFLKELIKKWLQWPYDRHQSEPTVEALCKALRNRTVGLGALAKKVEQTLVHGQLFSSDSSSSEMLQAIPQNNPALVDFTGPLATKKFQRLDWAFCKALSACNTRGVMSATEEILLMNVSIGYKCISLVHRARCKAHCQGQRDKALFDCDQAIKLASNLESENESLIKGRALTLKASILRWSDRPDEALTCVSEAKDCFFLAAPSSDCAALLYEDVRMKICIALSKGEDIKVYISQVQKNYNRIFKLLPSEHPRLCTYRNAHAEVYLRTYYLDDELPFSAIPIPTDKDLRIAEEILKNYPVDKLPTKPHGNRGWYYRNYGDLCMWRKQYSEAIEWAKMAQSQFTMANMKHISNPKKRIELYQRLQLQQMKAFKQEKTKA